MKYTTKSQKHSLSNIFTSIHILTKLATITVPKVAAGGVKDDCGGGGIASGDEDANVCTICLDSMQEVCIFGL
jgi:hypothetical protein